MPYTRWIILSLAFFIVGTVISAGIYLGLNRFSQIQTPPTPASVETASEEREAIPLNKILSDNENTVVNLPVPKDNPTIKSLSINYVFDLQLMQIKRTEKGFELSTNFRGSKAVPQFIVTKETKIYFRVGDKRTPASVEDLKAKQKLRINSGYNVSKKTWSVYTIDILVKSLPSLP